MIALGRKLMSRSLRFGLAWCMACITCGCASQDERVQRDEPAATRPAGQGDYLSAQAGLMAHEDAGRVPKPAAHAKQSGAQQVTPIQRDPRSPVDQPRLR